MKFYIKSEIVNSKIPMSKMNPTNPDYYLQIEKIYVGIEVEQFLLSHVIHQNEINSIKK